MHVMALRDESQPLSGFIELDDAYLGGERSGGKTGRGAEGKTPFVAAVETTAQSQPQRVKLSVVKGFRSEAIAACTAKHVTPGNTVISDGLACFNAVKQANCDHHKIVCAGGKASVEDARILLGQHDFRQFKIGAVQYLPCHQSKICSALLG